MPACWLGERMAAHLALIVLSIAAGWALTEIMPIGLAFLVVGVIWVVVAAVLYVIGRDGFASWSRHDRRSRRFRRTRNG